PFPTDVLNKAAQHAKAFLSVEMSMGQMVDDVRLAINCSKPVSFYGRTGGMIPTPDEILQEIIKLGGEK
ncbi:MAG: 3-methyl-2-oxobutanoate dehydrogenase subunit beta, partial [Acutalibacteraceae bacterium]